jgi:F-type H+-transporting ATPase subunit epsilon
MLNVTIVTPTSTAFSGEALEVCAPGFHGEFGVLPQHVAFLSVMRPGVVRVRSAEGERAWVVGPGFVEAGPDRVTVLAGSVEGPGAVPRERAEADLEDANRRLAESEAGTVARQQAERDADLARGRLG